MTARRPVRLGGAVRGRGGRRRDRRRAMTGGPGAASGDRAARSREPDSGQSGPRPERPAEHSGPPGRGARDPEQLADPMDLVGPDGLDVPGVGPTTDPNVGGEPQAAILADVAGLTAERDEYLAALQRLQADFANYRKRVLRQQEEQSARAALDLVGKLLPVLDTLDLARAHLGGSTERRRLGGGAGARPGALAVARRPGQGGPGAGRPGRGRVRPDGPRRGGQRPGRRRRTRRLTRRRHRPTTRPGHPTPPARRPRPTGTGRRHRRPERRSPTGPAG